MPYGLRGTIPVANAVGESREIQAQDPRAERGRLLPKTPPSVATGPEIWVKSQGLFIPPAAAARATAFQLATAAG